MAHTLDQVILAEETLAFIEKHPESHDQGLWIESRDRIVTYATALDCGTFGCFAGWAVLISGAEIHIEMDGVAYAGDSGEVLEGYAANLLGVEPYGSDTDHLFSDIHDIEDLRGYVAQMRRSYEDSLGKAGA
jgi:hypothetical protein